MEQVLQEKTRDERGRLLPGHTANPNGRPPKKKIEDYIGEDEKEELVQLFINQSREKPELMRLLIEQLFGKAKQTMDLGNKDDKPFSLEISEKIAKKKKLYDIAQHAE